MENVADALKMAASVIIFVLALSVTIHVFSDVRSTSENISKYRDREYITEYIKKSESTDRIVGVESIIPTINRSFVENYKIVFEDPEIERNGIYKKKTIYAEKPINEIDLSSKDMSIGSDAQKAEFINLILFGNKVENFSTLETKYKKLGYILHERGLYDIIKGKKYEELVGVYLMDDEADSSTPKFDRVKKRIITYKEKS